MKGDAAVGLHRLLLRAARGRRRVSGLSSARAPGVVVGAATVIAVIVGPVRVGVVVAGTCIGVRAYILLFKK